MSAAQPLAQLPYGLARVQVDQLTAGGIQLQLSIARPLSPRPASFALYVLDPEPELFAIAAGHMFGRFGFEADGDDDASLMRECAIIGVGHAPASFGCNDLGWHVEQLRELRRAHFLRDEGGFLQALCEHAVPRAEELLGVELSSDRRALLGCSLSSLLALRALLRSEAAVRAARGDDGIAAGSTNLPRRFDVLVLGSPSLPLAPSVLDEAYRSRRIGRSARPARMLIVTGEVEADPVRAPQSPHLLMDVHACS